MIPAAEMVLENFEGERADMNQPVALLSFHRTDLTFINAAASPDGSRCEIDILDM